MATTTNNWQTPGSSNPGRYTMTAAPCSHDEQDLNLSSYYAQETASVTVLALDPEHIAPSGDDGVDLTTEATYSMVLEQNTV